MMDKKSIRFIVNPLSGTGKQVDVADLIAEYLDLNKFQYSVYFTERKYHATELAKDAIKDRQDIVIAVGGDGTVNEVAKGIVGSAVALGILPAGSGNGLARHFGYSMDFKEAILQINEFKIHPIDTCLLNGEFFLNVSGVGFDAHIAHEFDVAGRRGLWTYGKLILKEWFTYKAKNYRIKTEGLDVSVQAIFISFANGTQYGNDLRVAPLADDNDGLLDLCVLERFPKILTPILIFYFLVNQFYKFPYVKIYRSHSFDLEMENGRLHLDGEPKNLGKSIHIAVKPSSLKVLRSDPNVI